jgi:hypothetical protein
LKVYVGNPVLVILCFDEILADLIPERVILEDRVIIVFVTDGDLERVVVSVLIGEYVIADGLVLGELLPE